MTLQRLYQENRPGDGDPLADDMGGPAGRVHDWRTYAEPLRALWPSLSPETRMAVAIVAGEAADAEEWG